MHYTRVFTLFIKMINLLVKFNLFIYSRQPPSSSAKWPLQFTSSHICGRLPLTKWFVAMAMELFIAVAIAAAISMETRSCHCSPSHPNLQPNPYPPVDVAVVLIQLNHPLGRLSSLFLLLSFMLLLLSLLPEMDCLGGMAAKKAAGC